MKKTAIVLGVLLVVGAALVAAHHLPGAMSVLRAIHGN
jgi:hypothetical protein